MRVPLARPFTATLLGAVVALTLSGCSAWLIGARQKQRDEVAAARNARESARQVYASRCQPRQEPWTRVQCLGWQSDLDEAETAIGAAIDALDKGRADAQVERVRKALEAIGKW